MTPDSHDLTAAGEVRDLARRLRASTEMMASHALGLDMHSWSEHCNNCLAAAELLDASPAVAGAVVPAGYRLVPEEPTEAMWGGLARDLVMWTRHFPQGDKLFAHLTSLGRDIPQWLRDEVRDVSHVPPKGTVAACIYKAMLAAAPAVPGGWRTERAAINMWRDDALTKAAEIVRRHFGEDGAACAGDIRQLMSCFTPPAPEQGETDAE